MKQFTSSLFVIQHVFQDCVWTSIFNGHPINQYEEAPYGWRRMSHMKTPPLDVLLRSFLRQYISENVSITDDQELVINEQSPVNPARSLPYPPPQPPHRFVSTPSTAPHFPYLILPPISMPFFPLFHLLCPSHLLVTLSCDMLVALLGNYQDDELNVDSQTCMLV